MARSRHSSTALLAVSLALLVVSLVRRDRDAPTSAPGANVVERNRGREARQPLDIPHRGWKDILWRVYGGITRDRLLANAAGVAFYALLAIFPALAAIVSIYGLFADPGTIAGNLQILSGVVPVAGLQIVEDQLTQLSTAETGSLSLAFILSLGLSLWSANSGTKSFFDALNVIYGEDEKRGFVTLTIVAMVFTIGLIAIMLFAMSATVVLPVVIDLFGLAEGTLVLLSYLVWPALLVIMALVIALLYRFGPSRRSPRLQWVSVGSVFATFGWLATSAVYSWYASNMATFNETYGSLGAVIGFMMWLWLSALVVLLGAEINAEIEHQTEWDSTVGPARPMGQRGAFMADTLGDSTG